MKAEVDGDRLLLPLTEFYVPAAAVPGREFVPKLKDGAISIPYTPEAVALTNRLCGSKLPGPAFAHWKYPGVHSPYIHQRLTVDFLTKNKRAFVLSGMGSGKSASAIWAAEWLRRTGRVKRVLIFSPLSTLSVVWEEELFMIQPGLQMAIAHGSAEKRKKAFFGAAPYVVTNHDSIRLSDVKPEQLAAEFDLIIVDEASIFKTWSSGGMPTRYRQMKKLAHAARRLWLLTGTPTPNSPLDAWALIKLVDKDFSMSKTTFQNRTMNQVSEYRWVPKVDAKDTVAALMQPAIRFSKEEVMAYLPPKVFITREVPLSAEQTKVRAEMKKRAVAEYKGQKITAVNAAVLSGKLIQIEAGVVFDEKGEPALLDYGPRYNELLSLIEQADGKVLIFATFTEVVRRLRRDLNKDGHRVAMIYGDVAAGRRKEIFHQFQKNDEIDIIVAHPGTMAHGITLTEATLVVWFTPAPSNELFEQANDRPHRPGQHNTVVIAQMFSTPEVRKMYERNAKRGENQKELLDIINDFVGA